MTKRKGPVFTRKLDPTQIARCHEKHSFSIGHPAGRKRSNFFRSVVTGARADGGDPGAGHRHVLDKRSERRRRHAERDLHAGKLHRSLQ
jgi:hypothetical protein